MNRAINVLIGCRHAEHIVLVIFQCCDKIPDERGFRKEELFGFVVQRIQSVIRRKHGSRSMVLRSQSGGREMGVAVAGLHSQEEERWMLL